MRSVHKIIHFKSQRIKYLFKSFTIIVNNILLDGNLRSWSAISDNALRILHVLQFHLCIRESSVEPEAFFRVIGDDIVEKGASLSEVNNFIFFYSFFRSEKNK